MSEETIKKSTMNWTRPYQLVLFPFNNGATSVYYILAITYIAYYGSGVLGLALMLATTMVAVIYLFDTVTDPITGALIDKINGKFGRFRPRMVTGNLVTAVSVFLLYFRTKLIPGTMMWLRHVIYVIIYAVYVIGYIFQMSCTRSRQTVLTNDPNQRPLFTIFNLVASMLGMGAIQFLAPISRAKFGNCTTANFLDVMTPIAVIISAILTLLAVIGVWEKDQPKHYGLGAETQKKAKISEYLAAMKENESFRRLMVTRAGRKLAPAIATDGTTLCMLYDTIMGSCNALCLPMMITGYAFLAPLFVLMVQTPQKHGQKVSLMRHVALALTMYVGVLTLLLLWQPGNAAFNLPLTHIDVYTIPFAVFFDIGYGAYYVMANMPTPVVTDCSDHETYRSGKYIPGVVGTLSSLVGKLVSSLSSTVVGLAVAAVGLSTLPGGNIPYVEGMKTIVLVLFYAISMVAWVLALLAMKGYSLTDERMKEIQAVNAAHKEVIIGGIGMEGVMEKWQTMEQVPEEFR